MQCYTNLNRLNYRYLYGLFYKVTTLILQNLSCRVTNLIYWNLIFVYDQFWLITWDKHINCKFYIYQKPIIFDYDLTLSIYIENFWLFLLNIPILSNSFQNTQASVHVYSPLFARFSSQNGQTERSRSRGEGPGPYRLPGTMYPGQGGVHRWDQPSDHQEREGTRAWWRHPDPSRVWAWSQETAINGNKTYQIVLFV